MVLYAALLSIDVDQHDRVYVNDTDTHEVYRASTQ